MAEWIFRGSMRLEGVEFRITADSEAEAIAKAKTGDYDDYDDRGAVTVDWDIDPATGELNE